MKIVGLDIGGANIKVATADGICKGYPFPMWKRASELTSVLTEILSTPEFRQADLIGVTTTAELADCFSTKAEGVQSVLAAVTAAAGAIPVRVWTTSGEFLTTDDAAEFPMLAAAANWHALATWSARAVPAGTGLLIDLGSTTTDVIPLCDGVPVPEGLSDYDRLRSNELLYTGSTRTPVCAMIHEVELDGVRMGVAAELFATALDVHVVLGNLPEDPNNIDTADSRPATREASLNRLAHMVCCDRTELSEEQILAIAQTAADCQFKVIQNAVRNRLAYLKTASSHSEKPVLLITGSGCSVVERIISQMDELATFDRMPFASAFHRDVNESACAFAVARLAAERCLDDLLPLSDDFFVAGGTAQS